MLAVKLNKNEYELLCKKLFVTNKYQHLLSGKEHYQDQHIILITRDQADEIRDLCSELLQLIGFDEKYELTAEGKILESLVDKFFVDNN